MQRPSETEKLSRNYTYRPVCKYRTGVVKTGKEK